MAEFYTDWEDPDGLAAWKKARELFHQYYADFFSADSPHVELINVPYEGYTMPTLKFNPENSKGVIVMHGGFASAMRNFSPNVSISVSMDIRYIFLKAQDRANA